MSKIRNIFFILIIFATTLFISGCKVALLDPKGLIAADEKQIMISSVLLMLIVVIPVIILTFAFAWHYREGNSKATYSPEWSHSTLLEVIWWSIPCVIVMILGYITWTSTFRLDPYKPLMHSNKPMVIQAISLEWKWLFIYPEQNIATINYVQFPVDVPVEFLVTAEGPMNSFQIPELAGQIYAMAGMQTKLHLLTNNAGIYQGVSANFTGEGFSDMKFVARATSQTEFNQWVQNVKQSKEILTSSAYEKLIEPNVYKTTKYFSSANQQIFANAIMKSMMPMKTMAADTHRQMVSSK